MCKEGENIVYDDLSGGRENIKIPVVSSIKCRPPKILYPKTKNLPIPKYLDEEEYQEFMICCSCTDGCQPKTCECMQLTYEGFRSTTDFFQKARGARSDLKNGLITQEKVNHFRAFLADVSSFLTPMVLVISINYSQRVGDRYKGTI